MGRSGFRLRIRGWASVEKLPAGMRKCAKPEEAEKEHQGGHGLGMAPSASSYTSSASTDDHKMEM